MISYIKYNWKGGDIMNINNLLGYKLICKISKEYMNEPNYSDKEFEVIIKEDSNSDSGYIAIISSYDNDNDFVTNEWDAEVICHKLLFGTWDIISKERI